MGAYVGTELIVITAIFVLTALHFDDKKKKKLTSSVED